MSIFILTQIFIVFLPKYHRIKRTKFSIKTYSILRCMQAQNYTSLVNTMQTLGNGI